MWISTLEIWSDYLYVMWQWIRGVDKQLKQVLLMQIIVNVYRLTHLFSFLILTHIEPRGGGGKFTPRPTFCCITPEPQQILKIPSVTFSQNFVPHMTV